MLTAEYEVLRQKMRAIASENLLSWMSDAWHDVLMQIPQQDRNKERCCPDKPFIKVFSIAGRRLRPKRD